MPDAIALSLEDYFVHSLMHTSILAAGTLFWTAILRMRGGEFGVALLSLFAKFKLWLIGGALLDFSSRVYYDSYANRGLSWGFPLLEDQQLGGILMMVAQPMYLVATVSLVARYIRAMEGSKRRPRAVPQPGQAR